MIGQRPIARTTHGTGASLVSEVFKGSYLILPVLLLSMLWVLLPKSLSGHGGGTPRLTGAEAGPYQVYAWSDPEPWRVGEVHLSLAVTKRNTEAGSANMPGEVPVTDASVAITLTPLGSNGLPIAVQATRPESLSNYYFEAETQIPSVGEWEVTIDVNGPDGVASTGFMLEVQPPRTINWLLVAAGGIGLIALISFWSRGRRPTAPRRRTKRLSQRQGLSARKRSNVMRVTQRKR